jgi:O-antigen/teichoic acid export membrane protein
MLAGVAAVSKPGSDAAASKGEGVVAGALFGLLTQVVTAAFTAALTLYLVRALGAHGYGLFSIGVTVAGTGALLADLALGVSAGRFMADAGDDRSTVRRFIAGALRQKLLAALVVGSALAALAGPIADGYGKPELAVPLRVFAISLAAQSLMSLWTSTFIAVRRLALNARMVFFESLVEAGASIALVALGGGVTGAAAGRAAGYAVGAVFGAALVARRLGRDAFAIRSAPREVRRAIARYARPLFATNLAYEAYNTVDVQLIAVLLTSTAAGLWAAPMRLVLLFGYVSLAVANAVSPRMSPSASGGPDMRAFTLALRGLLLLQVALCVAVAVWAQPIVAVTLGDGFGGSVDVLRALSPLVLLLGVSPLISSTANFLGQAGRRLPIVLVSLAVNAAIDAALLPALGVIAAAIGTTVAYGIYVPAHLRLVRRSLDVRLWPLAETILRALPAAGVMALVLAVIGTDDLPAWKIVAGAVLGPAAYLATLLATRAIRPDELRRLRAAVHRGAAPA